MTTMSENNDQTNPGTPEFDFSRFPFNTLFHERRTGPDRRDKKGVDDRPAQPPASEARSDRRAKKDRRRRIDPTTFDKQYTDDEMEFMNAMQRYKETSGKSFPTYREVLKILIDLLVTASRSSSPKSSRLTRSLTNQCSSRSRTSTSCKYKAWAAQNATQACGHSTGICREQLTSAAKRRPARARSTRANPRWPGPPSELDRVTQPRRLGLRARKRM